MKKISKVIVERIADYDSDLSYLGTFSREAGKFAVKHNGGQNTLPYFNAENVENMKQAKQNYNRIMEYENGNLIDYGVKATAEIITSFDKDADYSGGKITGGNWLINKIHSGGLWGLSSDGTNADFDNEAENQLSDLSDVLKELGFSEQEISEAGIEYKNWY